LKSINSFWETESFISTRFLSLFHSNKPGLTGYGKPLKTFNKELFSIKMAVFGAHSVDSKLILSLHFKYWQFTFVSLFEGVVYLLDFYITKNGSQQLQNNLREQGYNG
jgi:hypothetical protein